MPYCHLNRKERKMIAYYYKKGLSIRKIALKIGRSPSTISRELKRNSKNGYDPQEAYEMYKKGVKTAEGTACMRMYN